MAPPNWVRTFSIGTSPRSFHSVLFAKGGSVVLCDGQGKLGQSYILMGSVTPAVDNAALYIVVRTIAVGIGFVTPLIHAL